MTRKWVWVTPALLVLGSLAHAECYTSSRGYNFPGPDANVVLQSCNASVYTSNWNCQANLYCIGAPYPGPQPYPPHPGPGGPRPHDEAVDDSNVAPGDQTAPAADAVDVNVGVPADDSAN